MNIEETFFTEDLLKHRLPKLLDLVYNETKRIAQLEILPIHEHFQKNAEMKRVDKNFVKEIKISKHAYASLYLNESFLTFYNAISEILFEKEENDTTSRKYIRYKLKLLKVMIFLDTRWTVTMDVIINSDDNLHDLGNNQHILSAIPFLSESHNPYIVVWKSENKINPRTKRKKLFKQTDKIMSNLMLLSKAYLADTGSFRK